MSLTDNEMPRYSFSLLHGYLCKWQEAHLGKNNITLYRKHHCSLGWSEDTQGPEAAPSGPMDDAVVISSVPRYLIRMGIGKLKERV
jgi:hypothetical protein